MGLPLGQHPESASSPAADPPLGLWALVAAAWVPAGNHSKACSCSVPAASRSFMSCSGVSWSRAASQTHTRTTHCIVSLGRGHVLRPFVFYFEGRRKGKPSCISTWEVYLSLTLWCSLDRAPAIPWHGEMGTCHQYRQLNSSWLPDCLHKTAKYFLQTGVHVEGQEDDQHAKTMTPSLSHTHTSTGWKAFWVRVATRFKKPYPCICLWGLRS